MKRFCLLFMCMLAFAGCADNKGSSKEGPTKNEKGAAVKEPSWVKDIVQGNRFTDPKTAYPDSEILFYAHNIPRKDGHLSSNESDVLNLNPPIDPKGFVTDGRYIISMRCVGKGKLSYHQLSVGQNGYVKTLDSQEMKCSTDEKEGTFLADVTGTVGFKEQKVTPLIQGPKDAYWLVLFEKPKG